ncbi:MAG TPA: glycosyltransferase family A protein [Longimicrobiaceae bacterium]
MPRVTVVVATYDWSSVLPYSVGSALAQTFADLEVLVVGDGCTDDSEEVVGRIGDPRVRWINLPRNFGQAAWPNNEGLRQARGELVAYLGHDDLWLPHHLAVLVAAADAGADLAYAITASVDAQGGEPVPAPRLPHPYRPGMWIPPSCVLHRREAALAVGGWRDYRELDVDPEADLWRRIHDAGGRVAFVPRLGAVKFPAAYRRDVYRVRPCHEQAAWSERLRTEPDLEATLLARMLAASQAAQRPPLAVRLRARLAAWKRGAWGAVHARGLHTIEARRKFKGLPPRP